MSGRYLLPSLHDVTPFHLERLTRAERFLESVGIERVTYLLVPRFHGTAAIEADDRFDAWCHRPRPFHVHWFLHGFFHSQDVEPATGWCWSRPAAWFRSRFMTAREGEFLKLRGSQLRDRLERGIDSFRYVLGAHPMGFVPPAWLFNEELIPALGQLGIRFAENHRAVWDIDGGRAIGCPVITWATRTPTRARASRVAAPLLLAWWARKPCVRIALHPHDFDQPATVRSIEGVVRSALRTRAPVFYGDWLTPEP